MASHFNSDPRGSRFGRTPAAWLPIGKQFSDIANEWASRSDIVSFVGTGAVQDEHGNQLSIACFNPDIAEMEIAVDIAFGEGVNPEYLPDFTERATHFDYPEIAGAILHEAMHAKHSLFDLRDLGEKYKHDSRVRELVMWFEEIRIECRGMEMFPRNRAFLRSMALKFVLSDLKENEEKFKEAGAMAASMLAILGLGRVDATVLDHADVVDITRFVTGVFGDELLEKLQGIWLRALGHRNDRDWEPLAELALEWLKLLEENGHKTKPDELSEGEKQALKKMLEAMAEALEEASEDTAGDAAGEAKDQEVQEDREEKNKARGEAAKEAKEADDAKTEVFGRSTGPSPTDRTSSTLREERDPKPEERGAAIRIAKLLEKAKYQDRVIEQRRTLLPPGRMNGRAAMQRDVQLARGQQVTAEPWTHKHRYHTQDPELKIGLMTDISGSMNSAMIPMAVLGWVMSEAARRVQGKIAQVYYGNSVFPVLKSGQHLKKVQIYTAPDGTERFNKAFKALDGELLLLQGSGARLLVIASDMCYTPDEQDACRKWIQRCERAGVGVVSLPFTHRGYVNDVTRGTAVQVVESMDPVSVATEIGHAAVRALERAGNRVM